MTMAGYSLLAISCACGENAYFASASIRLADCTVVLSARPEEKELTNAWGRVESQVFRTPSISRSMAFSRSLSKRKSKTSVSLNSFLSWATSLSVALESSPERTSFPVRIRRPSCMTRPPSSRAFGMPSNARALSSVWAPFIEEELQADNIKIGIRRVKIGFIFSQRLLLKLQIYMFSENRVTFRDILQGCRGYNQILRTFEQ